MGIALTGIGAVVIGKHLVAFLNIVKDRKMKGVSFLPSTGIDLMGCF
ncbi:MAG: hypothetical protein H6925_04010 [Holosporaceae bacterium]|nr:MAG: hypothetical protein H6925_04010 [Holosporaceae bacterium]